MKEIVIYIISLVITVLTSGALFAFIQFLIQRHDTKKNIEAKIDANQKALSDKIDENQKLTTEQINNVSGEVKEVSEQLAEHKAVLARTHILRFADEQRQYVKQGISHSEEYFKQQILDIDVYNSFCEKHPEFSNGLTVMASQYIKDEYKRVYLDNKNP